MSIKGELRAGTASAFIILFLVFGGLTARAATFTVTKTFDSNDGICDADCSLTEAVGAANTAPSDDVINFAPGVFGTPQTIFSAGEYRVVRNFGSLVINGPGTHLLTITTNLQMRFFYIHEGAAATINNLTVAGGGGNGLNLPGFGGGIFNHSGVLTINNLIVRNNTAGHGGGILSSGGTLVINNSTIYGNTATGNGTGGGILCNVVANVTVTNTTISGNSAGAGAGIATINSSEVTLINVTIAQNTGRSSGGVDNSLGSIVRARNTIIADNTAPVTTPPTTANDFKGVLASDGYNLVESTFGMTVNGTTTGNILGQDPMLSALGNYGGQTPAHALNSGSPAIDAAAPNNFPPTDQRGSSRPKDGDGNGSRLPDIGAIEKESLRNTTPFDFDGDAKTDISIYRPSTGEWWINRSTTLQTVAAQFGNSSDKLAPADFTGDGKTDIAIWRPSTGEWYILRSENGSFLSFPFGTSGDVPTVGDFDADGKADPTVFRPSTGEWYVLKSTGGVIITTFGTAGDVPVSADFDGDGKADIAIFRPSDGSWWYVRSTDNQFRVFQFGLGTDKPVAGDYTGDGKADIAVWRPSNGEWFILRSEDNSYYSLPFGTNGDVPAPGDYDGDGRFDTAVFRPSNAGWYVQRSTAGILITNFGTTGDQAVPTVFVP